MLRLIVFLAVASSARALGVSDSLLENEFCQLYYPSSATDPTLPVCADVKAKVTANHSRPLPTLELGDPSLPDAMFFIHGWPDSAANFAPQFAHFCYTEKKRFCVAATWTNFHPDFPLADMSSLTLARQYQLLADTMKSAGLVGKRVTLVAHDWGAVLAYQMSMRWDTLDPSGQLGDSIKQTITIDVGAIQNPKTNVSYQEVNRQDWFKREDQPKVCVLGMCAPGPATWRMNWPYMYMPPMYPPYPFNVTVAPIDMTFQNPHSYPADTFLPPFATKKPLMFVWGNTTDDGRPRAADARFFAPKWLEAVEAVPRGKVVEAEGGHWLHCRNPRPVNSAIDEWLSGLGDI